MEPEEIVVVCLSVTWSTGEWLENRYVNVEYMYLTDMCCSYCLLPHWGLSLHTLHSASYRVLIQ